MLSITKRFRFEAAHRLENWPHDHQCHRLHGHSYVLEITLFSKPGYNIGSRTKPGVILDFAEMSTIVKQCIIERWDHRNLNEVLGIKDTTAEYLVHKIHHELKQTPLGEYAMSIRLYETQDGWAELKPVE